jgi:hypothetical protein
VVVKKKQEDSRNVTPRNTKPSEPAWVEILSKEIIPGSAVVNQDEPKCFVKTIQDEVVQISKDEACVLIKKGPAELRSVKVKGSGTVITEYKAFAKKLKKGEMGHIRTVEILS